MTDHLPAHQSTGLFPAWLPGPWTWQFVLPSGYLFASTDPGQAPPDPSVSQGKFDRPYPAGWNLLGMDGALVGRAGDEAWYVALCPTDPDLADDHQRAVVMLRKVEPIRWLAWESTSHDERLLCGATPVPRYEDEPVYAAHDMNLTTIGIGTGGPGLGPLVKEISS